MSNISSLADPLAYLQSLQSLQNQAAPADVSSGQNWLFWATCIARTVGTSGDLEVSLDVTGGSKLLFRGQHNGIGVIGAFGGTGPGTLMVDPNSLIGKSIDYIVAATPSVGIVAFNITWINTGNMSGAGLGGFVPPSMGKGTFTRR